jgi:arginine decarboxylase
MAAVDLDVEHWSSADAAELYEVSRWGNGYFSVGPTGHLLVHPDQNPT